MVTLCVALLVPSGCLRLAGPRHHPSPPPGRVRGIEALSVTAPLFLLLFAASYYVMARDDPASFSPSVLTRTDTPYFTVTTFATVSTATSCRPSEVARRLVTFQMFLDLLVLGFGIRIFVGAVQRGRQAQESRQDAGA